MRSFAKNGVTSTMTYDADGLRSSKTVNGAKTTYQYIGDKLFYESRGNGNSFYYFYDSYGKLSAIYHYVNGTRVPYHVTTNVQGDVIALYSWDGALVASYEYDAWGNCTITQDTSSTGIATLNPFRYRGYYFDTDLDLYYLQSRYYDYETGRFLNADGTLNGNGDITGFNMFAYCSNNPVMFSDPSGYMWETLLEKISDLLETLLYEISPETPSKREFGYFRKSKNIVDPLESIYDANEQANILPQNEMEAYTRDVHNLRYYSLIGQSYTVGHSPNVEIFGNDENYKRRCEISVASYNDIGEANFINIDTPWENLSEEEKNTLLRSVSLWDRQIGYGEKGNHGFRGGFSFGL